MPNARVKDAVAGMEPRLVWKYFAEISKIPRPSKHEEKIAAYVMAQAKRLGLEAKRDKVGNIAVRKPASKGRAKVTGVILQGHLDMVPEKNADKKHDFLKDPIELVRKGNFLTANGTTLGADNGIAVATNLAIMEDRSLEHGPLELLFTIDEETGLTGASNLGKDLLRYRTLLNLDSEEEGSIYVGCSGGRDTVATWTIPFAKAPAGHVALKVSVKGLRGGHSGLEIDKGRGNAIKLMNRTLIALAKLGARLSSIDGGNKRNAIPRECDAVVVLPKSKVAAAKAAVAACRSTFRHEFGAAEPGVTVTVSTGPKGAKVAPAAAQEKVLSAISALPHGVFKMSSDLPGLVETSANLAVIETTPKGITVATSQRSSVLSEIEEICHSVGSVLRLAGAAVRHSDGYPGWKPDLESKILGVARKTYRRLYRKDAEVKAIHAGLECGIIGEKYPGMDMVSFGPTLECVHSPDERIHIDTVGKFWKFLLAILKDVR